MIAIIILSIIIFRTLSPGNSPAGNLVTGGAVVNIGGTSCTSCTMTTTSSPAIFLVSCPGSAYASYTLKRWPIKLKMDFEGSGYYSYISGLFYYFFYKNS